jgi:hypothetical protein
MTDEQLKSYLNGVLLSKTETTDLINIANASGDLLIGYDGSTFINGAIDELKIFNSCLTETEIEAEAKRIDSIGLNKEEAKKLTAVEKGKTISISSVSYYDVDSVTTKKLEPNNADLSYKTSNKKIFTVTSDGKIKGLKAGKAKLTITYGCHSVTYSVTVK